MAGPQQLQRHGTLPYPEGEAAVRQQLRAVLISTYDLGHQPFGLASPAAWLRDAGVAVTCLDLAVQPLDQEAVREADLVALHVPMHTATRLAIKVMRQVRDLNPGVHLCVYGLYAPANERLLRGLGAQTVLGGEFEESLVALAMRLRSSRSDGPQSLPVVSLSRQHFRVPDRSGLPELGSYACVQLPTGEHRTAGYTEATRGCKHLCRHCPVVPVYGGRFRVVQREVVLEDIGRQVAAGAQHITFGDPDFFNGPAHAVAVAQALHERFPALSYDVTIKVEHLLRQRRHLAVLRDTGCLFVTTAVEAFDARVLDIFDKRHSRRDFVDALQALRDHDLAINPTFVAFTPWTTLASYAEFLLTIGRLGLAGNIAPIQYAIRLLIPEGSRLLELAEVREHVAGFDAEGLCYRWASPDPRVDELQRRVMDLVAWSLPKRRSREEIFRDVCRLAADSVDAELRLRLHELDQGPPRERIPYLTEPWFC